MKKMKEWIIENALASPEEIEEIHTKAKDLVRTSKNSAWEKCMEPILEQVGRSVSIIMDLAAALPEKKERLEAINRQLASLREPNRRDIMHHLHQALLEAGNDPAAASIKAYYQELIRENTRFYNTHLYHEGRKRIENIESVPVRYGEESATSEWV